MILLLCILLFLFYSLYINILFMSNNRIKCHRQTIHFILVFSFIVIDLFISEIVIPVIIYFWYYTCRWIVLTDCFRYRLYLVTLLDSSFHSPLILVLLMLTEYFDVYASSDICSINIPFINLHSSKNSLVIYNLFCYLH